MYTVFLAGNSPYIRSYTVYIYGSGQPYKYGVYGDYAYYKAHHYTVHPGRVRQQEASIGRVRGIICKVGQNRLYTPYMTVYLVMFLPKIPYITPYIYGSGQP